MPILDSSRLIIVGLPYMILTSVTSVFDSRRAHQLLLDCSKTLPGAAHVVIRDLHHRVRGVGHGEGAGAGEGQEAGAEAELGVAALGLPVLAHHEELALARAVVAGGADGVHALLDGREELGVPRCGEKTAYMCIYIYIYIYIKFTARDFRVRASNPRIVGFRLDVPYAGSKLRGSAPVAPD